MIDAAGSMKPYVANITTLGNHFVANSERDRFARGVYSFRMLSEWLRNALKSTGTSQAALARALTERLGRSIDRAAVNKMASGSRKIAADELIAIAEILKIGAPIEEAGEDTDLRHVTVAAHVEAGLWEESWEWPPEDQYEIAIPVDAHLRHYKLYAAETRGPSMNRRWPEQTVVVFTNAEETGESPIPGKRYVVERRHARGFTEHTVKLLHRDENGRFWLIPESLDPLHQRPIPVDEGNGEGDEVRIIGRVWYAVTRE